jgi:hypothetical protein
MRNPRWCSHTPRPGPQEVLIDVKVSAIDAPLVPLQG